MISVEFKKVVDDYLAAVGKGISLFKKEVGEMPPLEAWRDKKLPQSGSFPSGVEYQFHGIGCLLIFNDCEVDFDFGPDNRSDGFDLWRLSGYISSCPQKYPAYSEENLKKDFAEAVSQELIKKLDHPYCNLYFYS
ncbi:hypothetical protein [Microbulbifer sp. VAAF005]|uniref:DUF6896 domain-containing protein n=1 Tax=Microbulbifer sp. VAAF005 TaxID=3034230 RepID=UPI0024AE73F4|nr:hypothetical protein [Microbulbifer sp. VAAF005]WHI48193.1 hypothetical protein P0078_07420 [Microbulbifer sp. VAAF005]